MKNQTHQKSAEHKKEPGNGNNLPPFAIRNEQFDAAGKDLFTQQFKPGKTEEQILIEIVGKLTLPLISLNTMHPVAIQY